ncbi:MAG: nucleotide pyrophosphatase, partial [Saprospiraceae bacterium]|nr:nucleotide pyrophosphatase [Saprospiraceae bacterium]
MKKSPQLILIVLESTEVELVEKWMSEGHLPNLKKLKEGGVYSRVTTPAYISSGCVWPSLTVG